MPDIDSAQTATRQEMQFFSPQFDWQGAVQRGNEGPMALLLHELRGPLASIRNALAVLRFRGKEESLQQRMHELIERQVRQLTLLTSNLYPMTGAALATLQLERDRIDLGTVLSSAAETVGSDFAQRGNSLEIRLPESSVWVFGDASRLEQVFVNLLSNASKYSDVGGKVHMSMHAMDGQAVVQIRDFGGGIPAAAMPHIFDLFVRADTVAVRSRPGLGIGLALVRSIVESHEGTVSASSQGAGQGSEFTVRLKLET